MHPLNMFVSWVVFCCHCQLSFCHPDERGLYSRRDIGLARLEDNFQHRELQGPMDPPTSPPTLQIPPTKALSTRSERNATKGQIVYHDLTFLIPNEKHALLLHKMYSELRDAAANALNETLTSAKTIAPLAEVVFRYGALTFTIGCMVRLYPMASLLDAALYIFEDVMLAMYPLTFGLTWVGLWGVMYWALLSLDPLA